MPDRHHQNDIEELLRTMAMQSPAEQTQFLDELARKNRDLAARLSLHLGDFGSSQEPARDSLGLPSRFAVTRRLGQGAFGTVYEAYDREQGRSLALKILHRVQPDALFRFKQEFRVLANLRHPNLIELYELIEYDHHWFFTMELIRGESLLEYVRPGGSCNMPRLRRSIGDLTHVLLFLHENAVLHRDIKPDNAIVDDSGRSVLLDFGLARHLAPNSSSGTMVVGTPAYMAPEQIADSGVSYAADWYGVGGLIYHALTGRTPFEGPLLQMLKAKASLDPVPPSTIESTVPPDWDEMCCRLLDRRPEQRTTGTELLAWLEGSTVCPPARRPRLRTLVGRGDELERLFDTCRVVERTGTAAVVEIVGASGFGKTALLDAFAQRVASLGTRPMVIRGRSYEHESVPFKTLDPLVDDLTRQLQGMGREGARYFPKDISILTQLFPVLERVESVAETVARNPVRICNASERRRRAFHALTGMLRLLAAERFIVMCMDDLQWGDADSAAFFQELFGEAHIPPIMVVVASRSDQNEGDFLQPFRGQVAAARTRLIHRAERIGRLSDAAATELAGALLAGCGLEAEDPAALAAGCDGNPLLIEQFVSELPRLNFARESSRPISLAEFLRSRVSRLPATARQQLELLAAIGQPLAESVAVRLVGTASDASDGARPTIISTLVSQNFLRRRESAGVKEIEFQHDQIRAAIVENMGDSDRRALHLRIAEALVSIAHEDHALIGVQFALGGDGARAAGYYVNAATAAEKLLAFDRGARFLAAAISVGNHSRAELASLYERLGRAYAAEGRGGDASRAFAQACEFADDRERKLVLRRHSAEESVRSGNVRHGVGMLVALGGDFGIRWTDSFRVAAASIAWSRVLLTLRGLKYEQRRAEEVSNRDLARLDLYWALTSGLSLWDPTIGARFQLRHLRLALKTGDLRRVGLALAGEAVFRSLRGEQAYAIARTIIGESLAIGASLDDSHVTGTAHAMAAMCGYITGRWDEAREFGIQGERILREKCAGVAWELSVARNAAVGGLIWSGKWKAFAERLSEWSRDAQERGDVNRISVYRMHQCPVDLARDDPDQAVRDLDEGERLLAESWSARGIRLPHFFGLYGRGQVAIYTGRALADYPTLQRQMESLRRSPVFRIEMFAILGLLREGTLAIAAAMDCKESLRRKDLTRIATRCCKALRRRRAIWSLGLAMLVEAGIEAVSGRPELAAARWLDAQREFERSGMRMYAAASRYCRGRITHDREAVDAAEQFMREQGVKYPDRIASMLAPGFTDSRLRI
jgi:hypothetical protein